MPATESRKNSPEYPRLATSMILGYALLLLVGCASRTEPLTLPVKSPPAFTQSGAEPVPERWWMAFGDRRLNALIDTALAVNFDLKTAWERLQAAQAVIDRESSFLVPDLNASAQSGINFPRPDFVGGENVRIGLSSQYEVDLWGRIRSRVEAERFRAAAAYADYQTAALSLAAEIVRAWYQLTEAQNQTALIEEQIETNEQVLELIKNRFGIGQVRSVDILRQRQLVEASREQKVIAEARARVVENRLAVLLGRSPQEGIDYEPTILPGLPPLPETGLPAELVGRRPDVQIAWNQMRAADRDLATAVTNRYPRLSLSASVSMRANEINDVFENWAYSLAGNILAPVFYGGELRAEVDRNEAVKRQRLNEYTQAVLLAYQEVEDALVQESKQMERIQVIEEQLDLVRQTNEQLRVQYFNGTSNYLDVLTALGQEQQLRRDLLSANLMLLEFRISLYRAMAGGFETARETGE